MTIILELTYKVSPGLNKAVLAICPEFQEARNRARVAIESDPDLADIAKKFDFVIFPSVINFDEEKAKPIFRLTADCSVYFDSREWLTKKNERYLKATRIAEAVLDKMENNGKFPTIIHFKKKIVMLRHIKDADKYYCLPSEAKELKRKAMRSFEEAKEY